MRAGLAKAGWIVLIVLNIGMLLNHVVATFMVAAQRWAWASIWLVVLATAVTIAYGVDTIGLIYVAVAGVMALAQLATAREFFGSTRA